MKAVLFTRAAQKQLGKLPLRAREELVAKLERFVETGAGDIKKMEEEPGLRLRHGAYRAVFVMEEKALVVVRIGHRRDVYR